MLATSIYTALNHPCFNCVFPYKSALAVGCLLHGALLL